MIIDDFALPSADEGKKFKGKIYIPYGDIQGVVQFSPGMLDYGDRYVEFFKCLNDYGYVAAFADYPGHGLTVGKNKDNIGFFSTGHGYRVICDNFEKLYNELEYRFAGKKHFVMGHSMGSFVVREFIAMRQKNPAGAIIMGTGGANPFAAVGIGIAQTISMVKGKHYRSDFLNDLVFGKYNDRIKNPSSKWSWLSTLDSTVQSFEDDPLRNVVFTASGFRDLIYLSRFVNMRHIIDSTPKELPMLFLSGAEDPLGYYGEGIERLLDSMEELGFEDVDCIIYPNARHELCHDICKGDVFEDIVFWLKEKSRLNIELNYSEDSFLDY